NVRKEKMNELGDFLKELRGKKPIRQASEGIKISHTYLDSLEKGYDPRTKKERKPTPDVLRKISNYYNVPYVVLMTKAGYVNEDGAVPLDSFTDMMQPSSARKVKQGALIASGKDGDSIYNGIDLHEELTKEQKVFYKDALLSDNDKQKIDAMIEVMIDKESN